MPMRPMPVPALAIAIAALLASCASTGAGPTTPAVGSELAFEGILREVDTAPWAYDGNARLRVQGDGTGELVVELPARWNLCKATGIGDAGRFVVGQRVQGLGTVTAPGTVTVCEQAGHRIARKP